MPLFHSMGIDGRPDIDLACHGTALDLFEPRITPRYGSDAQDQAMVKVIFEVARRYVQQAPLGQWIEEETRPGAQYATDEQIAQAYLGFGYANYHASGSCRMGKDDAAPVDPHCRVRGVTGVRVVDSSLFPFMLSGNTNAPVMALAWRAADIIRATRNQEA